MARLDVTKTYKLYINGAFPRSESGRSEPARGADWEVLGHVCRASRKDLRDAVRAARGAAEPWRGRAAYNRGQIIYRMAEMVEGKGEEFARLLKDAGGLTLREARAEVGAGVDRLVGYAGWCDKVGQALGCHNAVAGPFYNFTVPEGTGACVVMPPDEPALLSMVTLLAAPLAAGCTVVVVAGLEGAQPLVASVLGEVCATSDVPAGVVNILTADHEELVEHIASHRGIDAVHAANLDEGLSARLRAGAAENVKRVRTREVEDWTDDEACESVWWIEPFVEMKTIWHPSSA